MPRKPISLGRADVRALAYPSYYSLAEQDDARLKLRALLGQSESELDSERRRRDRHPAESVTETTE
jgi:hypothetical protein